MINAMQNFQTHRHGSPFSLIKGSTVKSMTNSDLNCQLYLVCYYMSVMCHIYIYIFVCVCVIYIERWKRLNFRVHREKEIQK